MFNEFKNISDMKRLELRKTKTVFGDNKEYDEIVAWYPNPDYNKQNEYISLGNEVYRSKEYPNWIIHGSACFTMKELCYTICYWDKNGELKIVGSRILDDGVDWITLKELLKKGFETTKELLSIEKDDDNKRQHYTIDDEEYVWNEMNMVESGCYSCEIPLDEHHNCKCPKKPCPNMAGYYTKVKH